MARYQPIVTVRTAKGEEQVTADVFGAWAVHRGIGPNIKQWCLTHVPSGTCVPRSQTDLLTKAQAIRAARLLDEEFGSRIPTRKTADRAVQIIHAALIGALQS